MTAEIEKLGNLIKAIIQRYCTIVRHQPPSSLGMPESFCTKRPNIIGEPLLVYA